MASGRSRISFKLRATDGAPSAGRRLAGLLLSALVATVLLTTCGTGLATITSVSRSSVATSVTRAKLRSAHPNAAIETRRVSVSEDMLTRMLEQDLAVNQPYLGWLRSSQGDAAVARMEDNIRAPYLRRIETMRSQGTDHQDFDVQVTTVWGSLTFSTRSYDVNFNPMDPVSVLFTGNASPDLVFRDMVTAPDCRTDAQCSPPAYQDDKGVGAQYKGYSCQSGTQWVLMGSAGGDLEWRPSSRAVMRETDKCTQGVRDHMRIYGGPVDDVFGAWSVGTPHRETWGDGAGKLGHFIVSWVDARKDVAAFWEALSRRPGLTGNPMPTVPLGSAGTFQKVDFDGQAVVIDICPCP